MIESRGDIPQPRLIDEIIDRSRDKDGDGIDDEDERLLTAYEKPKYWKEKFFSRAVDWAEKAINGSNTAGRVIGVVLDVAAMVAPAGGTINKFRGGVKSLINHNRQREVTDMGESFFSKIKRFIKQKSTQTAIVSLAAIAGLVFGIDIDPAVFTETLIGIVTAASVIVAGVYNIYQMFQDEDKPKKQ